MKRLTPFTVAIPLLLTASAHASVEKETLELSKKLRPISNEAWQGIAGPRTSESYEIVSGDTLWSISKRLFGDAYYWPKIWALNNSGVTNPHVIKPGRLIAFRPGSGASLPQISVSDTAPLQVDTQTTHVAANDARYRNRSQEWRKFPKQPWEQVEIRLPPGVDPDGFSKQSKLFSHTDRGFELDRIVQTDKLESLGDIERANTEGRFLRVGDKVFIDGDRGALPVGKSFTVTQSPERLKGSETGNKGYIYLNLGRVKIVRHEEDWIVGEVTGGTFAFDRNTFLVPPFPRVRILPPVGAAKELDGMEASVRFDSHLNAFMLAQHKLAFIDRGLEDGLRPGMIFRVYRDRDPAINRRLPRTLDSVIAYVEVIHASQEVCTAIVLSSKDAFEDDSIGHLIADVSELSRERSSAVKEVDVLPPEGAPPSEVLPPTTAQPEKPEKKDELDELDEEDSLSEKEKKELKQLENWESNPPAGETAPAEVMPPGEDAPPAEVLPPSDGDAPPAEVLPPSDAPPLAPPPAEAPVAPPSEEGSLAPPKAKASPEPDDLPPPPF